MPGGAKSNRKVPGSCDGSSGDSSVVSDSVESISAAKDRETISRWSLGDEGKREDSI